MSTTSGWVDVREDSAVESISVKPDKRILKLPILDSSGSNLSKWTHAMYSWLVYLGYSWLLLPIHSEVITFESSFNDCFESSISHTMKKQLRLKAQYQAALELSDDDPALFDPSQFGSDFKNFPFSVKKRRH